MAVHPKIFISIHFCFWLMVSSTASKETEDFTNWTARDKMDRTGEELLDFSGLTRIWEGWKEQRNLAFSM